MSTVSLYNDTACNYVSQETFPPDGDMTRTFAVAALTAETPEPSQEDTSESSEVKDSGTTKDGEHPLHPQPHPVDGISLSQDLPGILISGLPCRLWPDITYTWDWRPQSKSSYDAQNFGIGLSCISDKSEYQPVLRITPTFFRDFKDPSYSVYSRGMSLRTELGLLGGVVTTRADLGLSRTDTQWNGYSAVYLGAIYGLIQGGVAVDCENLFSKQTACKVGPAMSIDIVSLYIVGAWWRHFGSTGQ